MDTEKYSFKELVDIEKLCELFEQFTAVSGFTTGLVDQQTNEVLIGTGWRDICTKFHRACKASEQHCKTSNKNLTAGLNTPGEIRIEYCENGLIDGSTPIIIEGKHLANLFTGQILFEPPDIERFKKQAKNFGYDEAAYLAALEKVPVVDEDIFVAQLKFLAQMATIIAETGLQRLQNKIARKNAEEQKELLRNLHDSISDLIFYKDQDSVYLGCNKAFEKFAGREEKELIGLSDLDIFPKGQAEFFREKDRQMIAEGKARRNEEWVEYPDGQQVLLDTLKTPYYGPDGRILGLIGVSRDISKLKKAEQQLYNEREKLFVTLRSIGDGVITTDTEGRVIFINNVAEQLTGWSHQEAKGQPLSIIFNIINEKTGLACENPVKKVLDSGKNIGLANHTALIAKDGIQRSIADSGAPILDSEGKIVGVVLVFRDVTQEKKAEEELLRIKKLESVGILAGGIAHDFNNILTAILGNIGLADIYTEKDHKAHPLLKEAEKASLRAKDLTQQLLTFSKGGDPVRETASITQIITDSADFVLHGSNVKCRYALPGDLWLVDVDTGQMSQVIQNLVINARHAMPEGGEINISCENIIDITYETGSGLPGDKYIKLAIADTGGGIPEKYLDKIFDPYFSTKTTGSGLGLAVTHSIINKHDGHISVRSKSGEGTTFTIYLPASAEQISHEPAAKMRKPEKSVKSTILVMDDEETIRNLAKQMLFHFGHDVLLARDGREAIAIFKEHHHSDNPVDVIIMDLTIPGGMGGKDAITGSFE
ncbi:MAG: PocR ligand-binding domain-containing protein [Pseudomonadota bacterium]|nr:PocR ligand-binding domain-containing protein [Pseudomonadota bacterium]